MQGICVRSLVFSGYSGRTDDHDVTEIVLKVALNSITYMYSGIVEHLFIEGFELTTLVMMGTDFIGS
jgi:hypothetical protein